MDTIKRNWWGPVIRGMLAIAFGVAIMATPGIALLTFVYLFGAYAVIDGVMAIAAMATGKRQDTAWWALLLGGAVSILAGVVAFAMPGLTALTLLFLIGARAVVTGIMEISAASRLWNRVDGAWAIGLGGVVSIIAGLLMFAFPGAGAIAMAWLVGAYAIAFGCVAIAAGFALRNTQRELEQGKVTITPLTSSTGTPASNRERELEEHL
jgi:uncharacterized membrane protein HdeD (DUF308 family)